VEKEKWQKKGAGHRQRLRDKFLSSGNDSLKDEEIIELLLTFGTPRSDCKEPARAALKKCGSLPAVLDASPAVLQQIRGIGSKNIFAIRFIHEVARRYLRQRIVGKRYVHSSKEVSDYLVHLMRGLEHEVFTVVFLDAAHAIIDSKILFEGTITVNTVYPREFIKIALTKNAAALIIAHNHPSGSLKPSKQDIQLTRNLHLACSFMHIQLLDHLLIGARESSWSFADHGLMENIRNECKDILAG
jgi:DNA repair protein RadC